MGWREGSTGIKTIKTIKTPKRFFLDNSSSISNFPDTDIQEPDDMVFMAFMVNTDDSKIDPIPIEPESVVSNICLARKTTGKICGAELKTGVNGFRSCSNPGCQVPEFHHTLKRRGNRAPK